MASRQKRKAADEEEEDAPARAPAARPPRRKAAAAAAAAAEEDDDAVSSDGDAVTTSSSGSDGAGGSSSEEAESADDADGEAFQSVEVDFEFAAPAEGDAPGLRMLLGNFLDGEPFPAGELAAAVAACGAATVVRAGDDGDVVGAVAALALGGGGGAPGALRALRAHLEAAAPAAAARGALAAAWAAPGAALLLAERLINVPPQIAPPLVEGLFAEVAAAGLKFEQYVYVGRAYADPEAKEGGAAALIHATPEGEALWAAAAWRFAFDAPGRAPVRAGELARRRVVLGLRARDAPAVVRAVRAAVDGA
jgi:protein BCP1